MRFLITYEGVADPVEVTPTVGDVLAFEREHKTTLGESISSGSVLWSSWLCWHALQRNGEARSFETWSYAVERVKAPDSETGDPTNGAPASAETAPGDSSPPSPSDLVSATST